MFRFDGNSYVDVHSNIPINSDDFDYVKSSAQSQGPTQAPELPQTPYERASPSKGAFDLTWEEVQLDRMRQGIDAEIQSVKDVTAASGGTYDTTYATGQIGRDEATY